MFNKKKKNREADDRIPLDDIFFSAEEEKSSPAAETSGIADLGEPGDLVLALEAALNDVDVSEEPRDSVKLSFDMEDDTLNLRFEELSDIAQVSFDGVEDIPAPSISVEDIPAPSISVEDIPAPSISVEDIPAPSIGAEDIPAPSISVEDIPAPSISVEDIPAPSISVEDIPAPSIGAEDIPVVTESDLTIGDGISDTDAAIEAFIRSNTLTDTSGFAAYTESGIALSDNAVDSPVYADGGVAEEPQAVSYEELSAPEDISESDMNSADPNQVDSTDMNLRIAFGLEEEEADPDEVKDAVKNLGDRLESDKRVGRKSLPEHAEYTDPIQSREIATEYKRRLNGTSARLFFCFILALVLVGFENVMTISELIVGKAYQFSGILDPKIYPVVYIMVSLQLLLFCALFALPELTHGVKRFFKGAPTPESITVLFVIVGSVVSCITAFFAEPTSYDDKVPVLYNALPAVACVMTLVYSRLTVKRELMTFFVAGSKKSKYAVSRVPDDEVLIDVDAYDDMYGDVMRIEKTGFIDGFFSRMSVPDGMTTGFTVAVMGVAVAVAVILGVIAGRAGEGVSGVAQRVYLTLISLLPISVYLTFSYPFYRACSVASESGSAIIGEGALDEYGSTSVVSFDDSNVFPSFGVKVQNIKIYNNARIDRVLYYASGVFSKAGGPLADVFEVATMEMGRSTDVQINDADKGYLSASCDGVGIVFGTCSALRDKGYKISDEIACDDVDFSDELSIMYMFREDILIAKMYIKYVLDGDMEPVLRQFQDYGMYVCVRTYDPNIDEDMICAKLSMKNPPIKVVRYRSSDVVRGKIEKIDSGFVTYGSPKSLLMLLPYCDKTVHTKRTCGALAIMSIIISLMLLVVFNMSGELGFLNSLYVTLYHFVWMIPVYLASKIFIR